MTYTPTLRKNLTRELEWDELDKNFEDLVSILEREEILKKFTYANIDFSEDTIEYFDLTQRKTIQGQPNDVFYDGRFIVIGNLTNRVEVQSPFGPFFNSDDVNITPSYDYISSSFKGLKAVGRTTINNVLGGSLSSPSNISFNNCTQTLIQFNESISNSVSFRRVTPNSSLTSSVSIDGTELAQWAKTFSILVRSTTIPVLKIEIEMPVGSSDRGVTFTLNLNEGELISSSSKTLSEIFDLHVSNLYDGFIRLNTLFAFILTSQAENLNFRIKLTPLNIDGTDFIGDGTSSFDFMLPSLASSESMSSNPQYTTGTIQSLSEQVFTASFSFEEKLDMKNSATVYFECDVEKINKRVQFTTNNVSYSDLFIATNDVNEFLFLRFTPNGVDFILDNNGSVSTQTVIDDVINSNFTGVIRACLVFKNSELKVFINGNLIHQVDLSSLNSFLKRFDTVDFMTNMFGWISVIRASTYALSDEEATKLTNIV